MGLASCRPVTVQFGSSLTISPLVFREIRLASGDWLCSRAYVPSSRKTLTLGGLYAPSLDNCSPQILTLTISPVVLKSISVDVDGTPALAFEVGLLLPPTRSESTHPPRQLHPQIKGGMTSCLSEGQGI